MGLQRVYEDRSAVSSVISVVLMVAVTVVLAAVVATFALDIGESTTSDAPQASFDIEQETRYINATAAHYAEFYVVKITHTGGDDIDEGRLSVRVGGEQAWGVYAADNCGGSDPNCDKATALWDGSSTVSAGSSVTVVHSDDPAVNSAPEGYSIFTDDGSSPEGGSDDIGENILVPTTYGPSDTGRHIDLDVGETVRVVWESERSGETAVLAEHEIPE